MTRVAVVGAGVAGLTCARRLSREGMTATVIEKARGPGGRVSTRREHEVSFDHGAQFFTARDPRFAVQVQAWLATQRAQEWSPRWVSLREGVALERAGSEPRYVGVPGMSAITRDLSGELNLLLSTHVAEARPERAGWYLKTTRGEALGPYEHLVVATPAPQASALLSCAPDLAQAADAVELVPCWALLAQLAGPAKVDWDVAEPESGPLRWIARNSSKPGRRGEAWVAHAAVPWSLEHLEVEPGHAEVLLSEELRRLVRTPLLSARAHRWRYAHAKTPSGEACLWDPQLRVGACGDWFLGARVEAAFLSGLQLAERILSEPAA